MHCFTDFKIVLFKLFQCWNLRPKALYVQEKNQWMHFRSIDFGKRKRLWAPTNMMNEQWITQLYISCPWISYSLLKKCGNWEGQLNNGLFLTLATW